MNEWERQLDDLRRQARDIQRQIDRLARLDVVPPIASIVTYSGTPTAGHLTYWTGAGTVADSGVGTAVGQLATTNDWTGTTNTFTSATFPPLRAERTSTQTVTVRTAQSIKHTTTGNMGDGFGTGFAFELNDNGLSGTNIIGEIDGVRDDADNSGYVLIRAYSAGTPVDVARFTKEGRLELAGVIRALTSSGLVMQDDGGNEGFRLIDGAVVSVGGLSSVGASVLGVRAGTSTNDAAVSGNLYATVTQTGNVGTGEDDLASYSIPANTLSSNGMRIEINAIVSTVNNANAKTIKLYYGATVLASVSQPAGGLATSYHFHAIGWRTGSATQLWTVTTNNGATSHTTSAETLSGAVITKVTGDAVSNNDIVIKAFAVDHFDTNI